MKIIFVDRPLQDDKTLDPQVIDGRLYHWCVNAEMAKTSETFQEWWIRKQEYMINHLKGDSIDGIFLYDITIISGIIEHECKASLMVRYQWKKIN